MNASTPLLSASEPILNSLTKGMPGGLQPLPLADVGSQGWNLLREDLNLPAAVIRQSALQHNSRWMQAFLAVHDGQYAPHGKTTMSPELFNLQLQDGAWGITVATAHQLQVARHFGVRRTFLANQLVGRQAIEYVLDAIDKDPQFDFYCVVDSVEHVRHLAEAAARANVSRPLQVLVEVGITGARSGCRDRATAIEVARTVHSVAPLLSLRGVEGFEGIVSHPDAAEVETRVARFLGAMRDVAEQCDAENLYGPGIVLLSAGGSAFYDIVLKELGRARLARKHIVLTRSGCYLTHDVKKYEAAYELLAARSADTPGVAEGPRPALEVWAYVHSRPEPGRVIVGMGKRDVSYDDLPIAQQWYRPGQGSIKVLPLGPQHDVIRLDDQHAYLDVHADSPLRVGDMVQFGISHPCLTFDKWRSISLVNDQYDVVGAISTYF
jgi:D-serine dehydratase